MPDQPTEPESSPSSPVQVSQDVPPAPEKEQPATPETSFPDTNKPPSLHQTYTQATSIEPDKAAKIRDYSASTGETSAYVDNHFDDVKKQMEHPPSFFDDLQRNAPNTASFVANKPNMEIHQNDLENLQQHEKLLDENAKKTGIMQGIFNTAESGWKGMFDTVVGLPAKIVDRAESEIYYGFDKIPPGVDPSLYKDLRFREQTEGLRKFNDALTDFTSPLDKLNTSNRTTLSERLSLHDWIGAASHASSMVASFLPIVGAAAVTGQPELIPAAFAATGGSNQALEAELAAREEGATKGQAMLDGAIQGTVSASLNYVLGGPWFGKLLQSVPAAGKGAFARQLALNLTKSAGAGVGMTWGQGLANAAADQATGVNPNAIKEFMPKTGQLLVESLMFPAITLMHEAPASIKELVPPTKAQEVQKQINDLPIAPSDKFVQQVSQTGTDYKTLSDMLDAAKKNTVNAQNPKDYKAAIKHLATENPNATTDVHFDPEEVHKLFASHNQDVFDYFDGKKEEIEKAQQNGYDFSIPIEDFLSKANDPMTEKLLEHAKLDPKNLSPAELKQESIKEEERQTEAKTKAVNLISELAKEPEKTGLMGFLGKVQDGLRGIGERVLPAQVLAKGLKTMAGRSGTNLDEVLKEFKYNFVKDRSEPTVENFRKTYESSKGTASPEDYVKYHGLKLLLEEPTAKNIGSGSLDDATKRWNDNKATARDKGIKFTTDRNTKGAITSQGLAERWFDAATGGEIDRTKLPQEWWDEGQSGRPAAKFDDIVELLRKGSGVEKLMAYAAQPMYQDGLEAFGIKPEEGKKSKADEVFNDKNLKPNLDAKQQDMFPGKGKTEEGPQQTLFQSGFTPEDYKRLVGRQRELEDLVATARDPKTGKTWTGDEHSDAFKKAEAEGVSRYGLETGFTKISTGKFMTREEADKQYQIGKSSSLLYEMAGNRDKIELYQQLGSDKRGKIEINPLAGNPNGLSFGVYLKGDQSTFFHEIAHSFLYVMHNLSERPDAKAEIKEMMKDTLDWLGVKDWAEVGKSHHEMFARGFEYRLWTGGIPVPSMEKAFNTFQKWMQKVYPSSQHMEEYLGGKVTPQMRSVYDRILATDSEIAEAKEKMGYNPEAPPDIPEIMKKEWEAVNDKLDGEARKVLASEMMKDGSARTEQGLEIERQRAREKASDEISKTPVFGAMDDLKGLYPDNPERPMDENVQKAAHDISKGEGFSEEDYKKWNDAALAHGFQSPESLANEILGIQKGREQQIEEETNQEMTKYKLIKEVYQTPKGKEKALEIMHERAGSFEVLALESQALREKMNPTDFTVNAKTAEKMQLKVDELQKTISRMQAVEKNRLTAERLKDEVSKLPDLTKNPIKVKGEATKVIGEFEDLNKQIEKFVKEVDETKTKEGLEAVSIQLQKELKDQMEKMAKKIGILTQAEIRKAERSQMKKDAQAKAIKTLDNTKLSESARPDTYLAAERNAAVKSREYELKGKDADAYDEKQKQMDNHALYAEAKRNQTKSGRILKNLSKYASRGPDMMGMSKGFISPIDSLLEKFHLKQASKGVKPDMGQTADELASRGLSGEEIAHQTGMAKDQFSNRWRPEQPHEFVTRIAKEDEQISHYFTPDLQVAGDTHYKDLTMGQLKKLSNAVNMIASIGKNWDKSYSTEMKQGMGEIAAMTADSIDKNMQRLHRGEGVLGGNPPMSGRRVVNALLDNPLALEYGVQLPHLADLLDAKDQNGMFHRAVVYPLRGAERNETGIKEDVDQLLKPIYEKHLSYEQRLKDKSVITMKVEHDDNTAKQNPDGTKPKVTAQLTKDMIRQIAKYWGSTTGRERILSSTGWTDEYVEKKIFDVLDKNDWDLISKETKALHDYFWPKTVAYMMDRYKVEPTAVENRPFQTKFGEMPGWYTHIEYDPTSPGRVLTAERDVNERRHNFIMYPDKSFTEIRKQTANGMIVDLSGRSQENYITDAAHFLAFNDAIRDVRRVTDNQAVKKALDNGVGQNGRKVVENTVNYMAAGEEAPRGALERLLRSARIMWTTGTIAFRPMLASLKWSTDQESIFARIKAETGGEITAKDWASAYKEYGPAFGKKMSDLRDWVNAKDPMMATMHKNFDTAIRTVSMTPPGMPAKLMMRAASKIAQKTGIPMDDVTAKMLHVGDWTMYHGFIAERTAMSDIAPRLYKLTYDRAILKMDEETAKSYAFDKVSKLIGAGDKLSHPGIYQSGEVGRSLAPAYTFMSMIYNHLWKQGKFAQLEYTKKNFLVANYTLAKAAAFIGGLGMIEAGNRWIWANKSGMSDDEKKKKFGEKFKEQIAAEAFEPIPVLGYGLGTWIGHGVATGKWNPRNANPFIPGETLGDYEKAAGGMMGLLHPSKMTESDWEEATDALAMVTQGRDPKLLNNIIFNLYDNSKNMPFVWQDLVSRKMKKPHGYRDQGEE